MPGLPGLLQPSRGLPELPGLPDPLNHKAPPDRKDLSGLPALLQPLPDRPDLPTHKAPPGLLLPSRARKGRKGPPGLKVHRERERERHG